MYVRQALKNTRYIKHEKHIEKGIDSPGIKLLAEKNDFQKAYESMQDEINAKLALMEEEEEPEEEEQETVDELEEFTDLVDANETIREYYEQLEKLQDSILSLQIENTLLREAIEEYTN